MNSKKSLSSKKPSNKKSKNKKNAESSSTKTKYSEMSWKESNRKRFMKTEPEENNSLKDKDFTKKKYRKMNVSADNKLNTFS
jgi:hypothetical protein